MIKKKNIFTFKTVGKKNAKVGIHSESKRNVCGKNYNCLH